MNSAPVREGEVIADKFRIGRRLGAGGMGVVMAATHLELDAPVALKFLLREDEAFVERFLREARAAARLSSEHVARVFDVGRLPSGAPYVVMEYLEGETIAQHVTRAGHVSVADAVDWVVQTCAGLSEAHAAGIVHRDIKPANLFLVRRADGTARVKILDFGVAKVVQEEDPGLTTPGSVVGSPSYASPEQLVRPGAVDHRADIWALGVTLYGLLARELPFTGETVAAKYMRILGETPVRVDTLVPSVPKAVADAVERCLAKEPQDRFPDAAALAHALEPFGSHATKGTAARLTRTAVPASTALPVVVVAADDETIVDMNRAHEDTAPAARRSASRRGLFAAAAAATLLAFGAGVFWYGKPRTEAPAPAASIPATPAPSALSSIPSFTIFVSDSPPAASSAPIDAPAPSASSPSLPPASPPARPSPVLRAPNPHGRDPRSYR